MQNWETKSYSTATSIKQMSLQCIQSSTKCNEDGNTSHISGSATTTFMMIYRSITTCNTGLRKGKHVRHTHTQVTLLNHAGLLKAGSHWLTLLLSESVFKELFSSLARSAS